MTADDLFFIPARLFYMSIFVFFLLIFINEWERIFNIVVGSGNPATFTTGAVTIFNSYAGWLFISVFLGLIIGAFVLGMIIPANIIFAPIFFIMTLVATWWSVPFAHGYDILATQPLYATYSTQMQLVEIIMTRLPLMILVIGCVLALTTYVKFRREEQLGIT